MHKVIKPINFPNVDNLVEAFKNNTLNESAIQFKNKEKNVSHSRVAALPFAWHEAQVCLLEKEPSGGRKFTASHKGRELHVSYLKSATLLGRVLVNSRLEIHGVTDYHNFGRGTDIQEYLNKPKTTIQEPVFYLGETKEYFHWILDCLTAIKLWREFGLHKHTRLLVANITDFKRETLNIYGVPESMIIGDTHGHIHLNHVFVPSTIGGGQAWEPQLFLPQFHRESIAHIDSKSSNKKYYISRSRTSRRKLINEIDVEKKLTQLGFEILYLEEYSFKVQITLMKSASIIVAPHGAGLTNIVYCEPNTTIVELLCERYLNRCFYKLSSISGLKYIPLVSYDYEILGESIHEYYWHVNLVQLNNAIVHLLGES